MLTCDLIDCHFHIHADSLDLSRVGETLQHFCRVTGVETVSIVCVPDGLHPGYDSRQVFIGLLLKALRPENVYVFGGLDYSDLPAGGKPDFAAQAQRLFDMGADGIKMLEGKPTTRRIVKMPLDSPAYEPFFAFLEEHSLPVLAHIADPPLCWDKVRCPEHFRQAGYFYANEDLPTFEGFQQEILNVARRHPGLKLILAHFFCCWDRIEQAAVFMDEYPNIAFDLTPGFEMYEYFGRKPGAWRDFFIRYGSRILFGTEGGLTGPPFGWPDALMRGKVDFMKRFLETAEEAVFSYEPRFTFRTVGLNLPPETLKKIYRQNFLARLSSQKPRPLNREPAIAECRRTIEYLRRAGAQTPDRGAQATALEKVAELLQRRDSDRSDSPTEQSRRF